MDSSKAKSEQFRNFGSCCHSTCFSHLRKVPKIALTKFKEERGGWNRKLVYHYNFFLHSRDLLIENIWWVLLLSFVLDQISIHWRRRTKVWFLLFNKKFPLKYEKEVCRKRKAAWLYPSLHCNLMKNICSWKSPKLWANELAQNVSTQIFNEASLKIL